MPRLLRPLPLPEQPCAAASEFPQPLIRWAHHSPRGEITPHYDSPFPTNTALQSDPRSIFERLVMGMLLVPIYASVRGALETDHTSD